MPLKDMRTKIERVAARDTAGRRRPAPWRPRWALAATGVAAVLAAVLVATAPFGSDGTGTALAAVRLPDGEVVVIERAFDRAQLDGLRRELAGHGVALHVDEVPVEPRADGRVYEVAFPSGARVDDEGRLLLDDRGLDEPIVVTIGTGSAEQRGTTAGLTLFEAFPRLCDAIVPDDPRATGRRLRRQGFRVRWVFIDDAPAGAENPTTGGDVPAPPRGTAVLSVLGPDGELTDVPRDARELMVEVAPRGSEILAGHEGLPLCR